jgi:excisionase family DNA binding protein
MPTVVPPGVLLTAADCARLDAVLMWALRDMQLRDGGLPRDLAEVAAPIHEAAIEFRANVLVKAGSGTVFDRIGSVGGSSVSTERLTVAEAARLTGASESYLRRLARGGVVTATRSGGRGEWILDGGSLAAWTADRNEAGKAA